MRHLILPRTLPGCHGNEIWDKVGYNSACVKDIFEIFGSMGGYGDGPSNASNCISPGRLHLPWQRNLGQNWLYLALCKRYLRNFCAYRGGCFGDKPANAANRILPRLTLVAMETKFGIKWAITRHMYEITPRLLYLTRGFGGGANK